MLRHFYAIMLYARTLSIRKVQEGLGHKNLNNTEIYTHLIKFKSNKYEVQVAETSDEAKKLGEAEFEHYDTIDNKQFHKGESSDFHKKSVTCDYNTRSCLIKTLSYACFPYRRLRKNH
jgi:hypothetical protein